ncbi:type II toxin-antitoxin system HicB family antitoxin [Ruegeria faecimaris]|uniref:type II toxin-antitoxin system HicB family antitoxin n=1 Tax=Ruegeria faecimaris TaxID=686389 RepID=UPI002490BF74|nr:type II toxin-antitoxin system HicB family antitoxin [Ruegeria faecimaris]
MELEQPCSINSIKTKIKEEAINRKVPYPMNYLAIVHHDPASCYGVSFPDVPGCFAATDKATDILKNAIAALDDYFSDFAEIPQPRDIETIRTEVAGDLAQGAYLLAVPYIPRDTIKERRQVNLERGVWDAIDEAAKTLTNGNVSEFLGLAARNEILVRQGQIALDD